MSPNVCILEYDKIYKFCLMLQEIQDFYSSSADANSFLFFDRVVLLWGQIGVIDLGCHIREYWWVVYRKLNDSYYFPS